MALVVGFTTSCDSDDPDYHTIGIRSLSVKTIPVTYYADQISDTLQITSTDSWQANTNTPWITFSKTKGAQVSEDVKYSFGTEFAFKEGINLQPNLTNNVRYAGITVKANGRSVVLNLAQNYYLNVTDPAMTPTGLITSDTEDFVKTLDASATATTIAFHVYRAATLETTTDWITLSQTEFPAGIYTTNISLQPNTTGAKRDGIISLKSSTGVVTKIVIRQKG